MKQQLYAFDDAAPAHSSYHTQLPFVFKGLHSVVVYTGMSEADVVAVCRCLSEGLRTPHPALPHALCCLQLGPLVGPLGGPLGTSDWGPPALEALSTTLASCPSLRVLDLYGAAESAVTVLQAAWEARVGCPVLRCIQEQGLCTRLWLAGVDVDGSLQWPTEHVLPGAEVLQRRVEVLDDLADASCIAAPVDAAAMDADDQEADSQPQDVRRLPVHAPRLAQRLGVSTAGAQVPGTPVMGVWNPLEQERAAAAEEAALAEAPPVVPSMRRATQPGRQVWDDLVKSGHCQVLTVVACTYFHVHEKTQLHT